VACSTAKAVEWDAAWSKNLDPSGRAALGVHDAAYEDMPKRSTVPENPILANSFPVAGGVEITAASATAV
jgi:asparagine synthase (glutamine-hydrolysing)